MKMGFVTGVVDGAQGVDAATIQTHVQEIFRQPLPALLLIGMIGALGLIGLPAVISLLRSAKPLPSFETHAEPASAVESPPAPSRERSLPDHASDSRLASQAV